MLQIQLGYLRSLWRRTFFKASLSPHSEEIVGFICININQDSCIFVGHFIVGSTTSRSKLLLVCYPKYWFHIEEFGTGKLLWVIYSLSGNASDV
jgi:hypothetical protein